MKERMTTDKNKPGESITVEPLHEKAGNPIWFEKFKRAAFIGFILVLGVSALTLVLSLPVIYFVDEHQKVRTESVEPAGKVMAITLVDGFFTRTLVETDVGFYCLIEGVSLKKDTSLTLEVRANKSRHLCDEQHRCTKLLEWS